MQSPPKAAAWRPILVTLLHLLLSTLITVPSLHKPNTPAPPHEPGRIPAFVKELGAECVVVGGIGQKARDLFSAQGIDQICGVDASLDEVISALEAGTLKEGDVHCNHGGEH